MIFFSIIRDGSDIYIFPSLHVVKDPSLFHYLETLEPSLKVLEKFKHPSNVIYKYIIYRISFRVNWEISIVRRTRHKLDFTFFTFNILNVKVSFYIFCSETSTNHNVILEHVHSLQFLLNSTRISVAENENKLSPFITLNHYQI